MLGGRRTVAGKLRLVITLTSALTLLVACAVLLAFDVLTFRARVANDLISVTTLVGQNCTAAVAFEDSSVAGASMRAFASMPHVQGAELRLLDGRRLALYQRGAGPGPAWGDAPAVDGHRFAHNHLVIRRTIRLEGEPIGLLLVVSDLLELQARLVRYAGVGFLVLLLSTGLAFLMSAHFHRVISLPIQRLSGAARRVRDQRDYAVRVAPGDDDELGLLTEAFNDMLEGIERRDAELVQAQAALQGHVSQLERGIAERERTQAALRSSEEQLAQAMKMEAVGKLAGGVAHDFNNLLTAISGYAQMLTRKLEAGTKPRGHAEEILKASARAAGLTRQLLAFSRKQMMTPEVLNVNSIVTNLERMLHRLIGEDIEIKLALDAGLGNVKADRGQLEQVIMNLAVNARDAMPNGGRLMLETSEQWIDLASAIRWADASPGRFCVISVTDQGQGMTPEVQARIFEPFFTTKEQGKGTGLGLSTVYGIVRQSGGFITVYSEPGHGTTFRIFLPRVEENLAPEPLAAPARPERRGSESLLLVEDEPMIRELACEALEAAGYVVRTATNGREALDLFEAGLCVEVQLLITDVVMPRMNGRELHDRALAIQPALRVLFMSGYSEAAIVHQGVLDPGIAFIAKPFTPDDLLRKVRSVLDDSAGAATA